MRKTNFYTPIFLFLICLSLLPDQVWAQRRTEALRLGLGVDVGSPTSDHTGKLLVGPSVRLQWDFPKRASLTLTSGYDAFINKDKMPEPDNRTYISDMIPAKVGGKFFFGKTYKFYAIPEAGFAFSAKKDYGNSFNYAGGIGYVGKKGLDMALRYEGFEFGNSNKVSGKQSFGIIALRVAYGLKLR